MPKATRADNGEPFGVPTRDVVPPMSLWLKAWGIKPILNRVRRPTDNAVVERGQGTTSRWAEPGKCQNLAELQQRLDEACEVQREKYPVVRLGNVTRSQLHKSLHANPRPFGEARFNESAAHEHLAQAILPRKVSANGTIVLYSKVFSIGTIHKGKVVFAKFCPKGGAWLVFGKDGTLYKTLPENRFDGENLINLKCQ